MKCEFQLSHPRADITMSDGHVIHAESAVEMMPTTLVTCLYNTYSNKAGVLRLKFSTANNEESVLVCIPSLSPNDRTIVYFTCIRAIFSTLRWGGMVYIKLPQKDNEWIHVSSLVSMEADPSAASDEHDEQTSVRVSTRHSVGATSPVLRSEF